MVAPLTVSMSEPCAASIILAKVPSRTASNPPTLCVSPSWAVSRHVMRLSSTRSVTVTLPAIALPVPVYTPSRNGVSHFLTGSICTTASHGSSACMANCSALAASLDPEPSNDAPQPESPSTSAVAPQAAAVVFLMSVLPFENRLAETRQADLRYLAGLLQPSGTSQLWHVLQYMIDWPCTLWQLLQSMASP